MGQCVIGLFIGIDVIFNGWSLILDLAGWILLGLIAKKLTSAHEATSPSLFKTGRWQLGSRRALG